MADGGRRGAGLTLDRIPADGAGRTSTLVEVAGDVNHVVLSPSSGGTGHVGVALRSAIAHGGGRGARPSTVAAQQ